MIHLYEIDRHFYFLNFFKRFHLFIYLFIYLFLFIFRQTAREEEREGEKHECAVASLTPPTGDLASNSAMCPGWESNQLCFRLLAGIQSIEPHQLEPKLTDFF